MKLIANGIGEREPDIDARNNSIHYHYKWIYVDIWLGERRQESRVQMETYRCGHLHRIH